ncbi:MAG: TerB family tellurite resistance protein [Planctomycetota bacterium]
MLTPVEAEAVVTIASMAALADGRAGQEEREQVKGLLDALAEEHDLPGLAQVHQRVLLKRTTLEEEAARLRSEDSKRTAFEMAVCVADADGAMSPQEQAFLDRLEALTGVDHEKAVAFEREADSIAPAIAAPASAANTMPESDPIDLLASDDAPAADTPAPGSIPADPIGKEVNGLVLRYAVLNGALELLPQNLATMAILPLQTRMVYAIGKRYGHTLSAGHIKEFAATLGIGATSQMLENFARKALGKLAKKALGKTAGKATKLATGPLMTFATTYAMGRVAKAYYAGGRRLSAIDLRSMFQRDLGEGKMLYEQYRPQVEANAASLSPSAVLDMVRGRATV